MVRRMLKIIKEEKLSKKDARKSQYQPLSSSLPGNKVFFISLGCPRNLVDTEVMIGTLLRAGFEVADQLKKADFIVINTCAFLEASRKEALDTIQEAYDTCKKGAKIIATGCMVQKHKEQIHDRFPNIHYMLGSGDVQEILQAVEAKTQGDFITDRKSFIEMGEVPRTLSTPTHYAYLKIAEGCRKRCAFCQIPDIKGPLKSKPKEQVLKEFRILRRQGVEEIILIAQDLGDFGKDIGYKKSEGLVDLLKDLLKEEGDFWIRLLYLYPDEISDELIALMKSDSRILRYIDMPIQHINSDVLKAMHRKTSKEDIINTLTKIRKELPDIVIRTSLIVGFPQETDEQFEELCQFVKEYKLDNIGIFSYSKEENTPAANMSGQIPESTKKARLEKLAKIQKQVVQKKNEAFVGKTVDAFVEGFHPDSRLLLRGRFSGQAPDIDGIIIINEALGVDQFGKRYRVEITGTCEYDLIGRVIQHTKI